MAHTWGAHSFDRATQVVFGEPLHESLRKAVPTVAGSVVIRKGWRAQPISISGEHVENTMADLHDWVKLKLSAVQNGIANLSLHGGGGVYENCELSGFTLLGVRPAAASAGFGCRYLALFTQLAPNAEE